jgi:hypothetical protein
MTDPLSLRISRRVERVVRGVWRNFSIDSLTGQHIHPREDLRMCPTPCSISSTQTRTSKRAAARWQT